MATRDFMDTRFSPRIDQMLCSAKTRFNAAARKAKALEHTAFRGPLGQLHFRTHMFGFVFTGTEDIEEIEFTCKVPSCCSAAWSSRHWYKVLKSLSPLTERWPAMVSSSGILFVNSKSHTASTQAANHNYHIKRPSEQ